MFRKTPEELANLLNLANDFRAKVGLDELNKLPKSVPRRSNECIIARAFNNNCSVVPSAFYKNGYITFQTEEDMNTYCELTGAEPKVGSFGYIASLTKELNSIAFRFDRHEYKKFESKT